MIKRASIYARCCDLPLPSQQALVTKQDEGPYKHIHNVDKTICRLHKMLKLPLRNPCKSLNPCKSPDINRNVTFFEGDNYEKLDCTTRRKKEKQLAAEALAREEGETQRQEKPIARETNQDKFLNAELETEKPQSKKKPFYGLRRPLEDGTTIEVEPGELDLEEWSDKPYSTVACHALSGYQDIFPLHMQKVTEAEDKDSKQIQTETRRHSVITTDYLHGRIKVENSVDGNDVHLGVFPMLHTILSSPSESESEDDKEPPERSAQSSAKSSTDTLSELKKLPVEFPPGYNPQQRRISVDFQPGRNTQQRRISIAAARHIGIPQPKVVRRRSLDYSGVSKAFVHALEAASMAMKSIQENKEDEESEISTRPRRSTFSEAAKAVFDPKYAEETMQHLEGNLRTLESFLESSSDSHSEIMSDEDDIVNKQTTTSLFNS